MMETEYMLKSQWSNSVKTATISSLVPQISPKGSDICLESKQKNASSLWYFYQPNILSVSSQGPWRHWSRGMMEASQICTCKWSMLSTRVRVPDGADK